MTALEFTRKNHRLNPINYLGQKWFFITMCCEHREQIFLASDSAAWIVDVLRAESTKHQFIVDAFCVMPDHLHFLAFGTTQDSNLLAYAKSFKQKTAYTYQQKYGVRLWQRNFYDHVLRADEHSGRIAAYIWMNPVRKGLCKDFEEYPFSGSFTRKWKSFHETEIWVPPWKQPKMPA
jgi:REP-associated tyrosine transposase